MSEQILTESELRQWSKLARTKSLVKPLISRGNDEKPLTESTKQEASKNRLRKLQARVKLHETRLKEAQTELEEAQGAEGDDEYYEKMEEVVREQDDDEETVEEAARGEVDIEGEKSKAVKSNLKDKGGNKHGGYPQDTGNKYKKEAQAKGKEPLRENLEGDEAPPLDLDAAAGELEGPPEEGGLEGGGSPDLISALADAIASASEEIAATVSSNLEQDPDVEIESEPDGEDFGEEGAPTDLPDEEAQLSEIDEKLVAEIFKRTIQNMLKK